MQQGRIKLHRQSMENPLYFAEKFTRRQARCDILLIANHTESFFYVRGNKITVKRGEFAYSENTLAERWQRSRNKVRTFLSELETQGNIVQQKNRKQSVYFIVKYDIYQTTESTTESTTEKQQTIQQKNIYKNDKKEENEKKKKKDNILSEDNTKPTVLEPPEKIDKSRKDITELIQRIKDTCVKLGVAYNKDPQDRNFAKHLLDAKEYGDFCKNIVNRNREETAIRVLETSIGMKYPGVCSGPRLIYKHYATVYNEFMQKNASKQSNALIIPQSAIL